LHIFPKVERAILQECHKDDDPNAEHYSFEKKTENGHSEESIDAITMQSFHEDEKIFSKLHRARCIEITKMGS
jgi:hypothetical protein